MKKIIYSLVIMIAAGSLFTSCIEQVEPVGLLDMRTAKAEYIRALKDLRAADAEYVRAKAAVEQANARYRDAETAFKNAQVENQNLLNELQELWNEAQAQENTRRAAEIAAEIEGIQMKMEELAAKHAVEMVKYEAQLAQAQEGLRVVLRDIAIASKSLSPNEKLAVVESAALVAVLTEAQAKAMKDVNKAQQKLDTLTFNALLAGTTWEDGYLEDLEEHYEDLIEEEQAKIVILEAAKALVPVVTAQLDEWQAVVDGYAKDSIAIAQEMAQQTYDSTAYVNATVKPGIVKFNKAIADFIDENWEEVEGNASILAEPAYTAAQKAWVGKSAPVRTADKYWEWTGGPDKTVALPPLTDIKAPVTWNKIEFLLTNADQSYGKIANPLYKVAPLDTMILTKKSGNGESKPDTLSFIGKVPADMWNFIVGTPDGSIGSQTYETEDGDKLVADYGLWGAYSILERVYVANQQTLKDCTAFLAKQKHDADSAWAAQNAILKAGLAAYEPYTDAIAEYKEKASAANAGNAKMLKAVNDFVTEWNKVAAHSEWSYNDSTAVFAAIIAFAEAREEYLDWTMDTLKNHGFGGSKNNQLYLPYVSGMNPYKVDTVEIKTLTFADIQKKSVLTGSTGERAWSSFSALEMMPYDGNSARPASYLSYSVPTYYFSDHGVFDWIVSNMMGRYASKEAHYESWSPIAADELEAFLNDTYDLSTTYRPLLGGWKYVAAAGTTPAYIALSVSGEKYVPKAVKDAEAKVKAKAQEFVAQYNSYWGKNETVTTEFDAFFAGTKDQAYAEGEVNKLFDGKLMENGKLNKDASYDITVFRPYGDDTPLVTFGLTPNPISFEGATIDTTEAFLAILTAVDPYTVDRKNNHEFGGKEGEALKVELSACFFGGKVDKKSSETPAAKAAKKTTLFQALYWDCLYYMATNEPILTQDLAKIKKWIEDVDKVFDNNSKQERVKRMKIHSGTQTEFDYDSTNYASYLKRKPVIDAYAAAKKAFVGTRTEIIDGKDSVVVNDLYIVRGTGDVAGAVDTVTKGSVSFVLTPGMTYSAFEAALFATNVYGDLVGWTKKLDGQQLANAKEAFGEKPYEQIQDWKVARKVNEAKQATLSDLKQKAEAVFVEKAKVEGLADPDSTSLASIEAQWNGYVAKIGEGIAEAKKKINGDPDVEGDKGYAGKLADAIAGNIDAEYLIKDAQIELAAAEAKLEDITKMLEKAQANLDKIMEYIRSTDAEFVIPVTIEEIDALIASVKKNLPTTASSIAALIAAYMGGADEEEDGD